MWDLWKRQTYFAILFVNFNDRTQLYRYPHRVSIVRWQIVHQRFPEPAYPSTSLQKLDSCESRLYLYRNMCCIPSISRLVDYTRANRDAGGYLDIRMITLTEIDRCVRRVPIITRLEASFGAGDRDNQSDKQEGRRFVSFETSSSSLSTSLMRLIGQEEKNGAMISEELDGFAYFVSLG